MLQDARKLSESTSIEAEVCIMGAGAAGITLANELKDVFSRVVILEAGGEQFETAIQEYYDAHTVSPHYPDPKESRLRFLGGATNHWANNTSPFSPIDFESREWVPNSGWPISYNDLAPFYIKAAQYCQTGSDTYNPDHWLPKLQKEQLFSGANNTELNIAKASVPPTRFFYSHGNQLVTSERVHIYQYASVTDIEYSEHKDIDSITFSSYNGLEHKVTSKHFIMALGGLENARMLLHFNSKYKNKLGNRFDNVGRYFMDHPTFNAAQILGSNKKLEKLSMMDQQRYIVAFCQLTEQTLKNNETTNLRMPIMPANEYQLSDGISSFHILKQSFANGKFPSSFGTHISNFVGDIDMVLEAVARKQFDTSLFDGATDQIGYQIPLMIEQTPNRNNKITLSRRKDKMGIPKLNVEWSLSEIDKEFLWRSLSLFGQDIGALSLGRVKLLRERSSRLFNDQMGFGHHHMGTTRMSSSEETGVVDLNQKVFGTNNFYIAGCSIFPTGSHVPPTLTIVATSIRLAAYIKEQDNVGRV